MNKIINAMLTMKTSIVTTLASCSNFFSNSLPLTLERINFIPSESSILFFDPYIINEGSGDYWMYGKDSTYHYHFLFKKTPYIFIPISNNCPHFNKSDFKPGAMLSKANPISYMCLPTYLLGYLG